MQKISIPVTLTGTIDDILQQVFFSKALAVFRADHKMENMGDDLKDQVRDYLVARDLISRDEYDHLFQQYQERFCKLLFGDLN